jgi:hypothetical protein
MNPKITPALERMFRLQRLPVSFLFEDYCIAARRFFAALTPEHREELNWRRQQLREELASSGPPRPQDLRAAWQLVAERRADDRLQGRCMCLPCGLARTVGSSFAPEPDSVASESDASLLLGPSETRRPRRCKVRRCHRRLSDEEVGGRCGSYEARAQRRESERADRAAARKAEADRRRDRQLQRDIERARKRKEDDVRNRHWMAEVAKREKEKGSRIPVSCGGYVAWDGQVFTTATWLALQRNELQRCPDCGRPRPATEHQRHPLIGVKHFFPSTTAIIAEASQVTSPVWALEFCLPTF